MKLGKIVLGFLLVFGLALSNTADAAIIEGRVQLPASQDAPVPVNRYELKNKNPIGPPPDPVAIVYLEGSFEAGEKGTKKAVMNQENYQFRPGMLAVQTGATVEFPNLDDDYHSIFSYSKAKRFDLGRYRKGELSPSVTFEHPGVIKTYCEIHEHMQGTIVVLDTPYFTSTGTDGRYRLEDLPAGQFTLKVWFDKGKGLERAVSLKDGETLEINFPE